MCQHKKTKVHSNHTNKIEKWYIIWSNDSFHWPNNKRRMHGLPTLRKPLNNKKRFILPRDAIFCLVKEKIEETYRQAAHELLNSFTSIEDLEMGQSPADLIGELNE